MIITKMKLLTATFLLLAYQSVWAIWMSSPEPGIDRQGADYIHFFLPLANPQLCLDQCAISTTCTAWSYVRPGVQDPTRAVCWLKSGTPPFPAINSNITSGIKGP